MPLHVRFTTLYAANGNGGRRCFVSGAGGTADESDVYYMCRPQREARLLHVPAPALASIALQSTAVESSPCPSALSAER